MHIDTSMHAFMYGYRCVRTHTIIYIHIYICICGYRYVHTHIYMFMYMHVCAGDLVSKADNKLWIVFQELLFASFEFVQTIFVSDSPVSGILYMYIYIYA